MQERIRVFYLKDIYDLHLKVIKDNKQNLAIDSASLMSIYGVKLHIIECKEYQNHNFK